MTVADTDAMLGRWSKLAITIAIIAGAATVGLGFKDLDATLESWLFSYIFILGFPVGCFGLTALYQVSGGRWGIASRPFFFSAIKTLPLMIVFSVPILLCVHYELIFPWAMSGNSGDALIHLKSPYLNKPFFYVRSVIFFVIWIGLGYRLVRMLKAAGPHPSEEDAAKIRWTAAPAIILYVVTVSFASFDYGMSLTPKWYSTMYGAIFSAGYALTGFAFASLMAAKFRERPPVAGTIHLDRMHDLGKLTFAFVMFWGYVTFSQFLIIWSGNLAEEAPWYLARAGHGYEYVTAAVMIFHFAIPWLLLLPASMKRNASILAILATEILVVRALEAYWQTIPSIRPDGFALVATDFTAPIFAFAAWFVWYTHNLRKELAQPPFATTAGASA